jgi:putative membrane protein
MKTLRRILAILLAILVIVFGVLFSLQNQAVIRVDLLFPQPFEQTTAFWVLGSFVAGVLLSLIVFSIMYLQAQQKQLRLTIKVKSLERQINKLETDVKAP